MKNNDAESEEKPPQRGAIALHGAHRRTLEALFRHPTAHNLEWNDVVTLIEKIGAVYRKPNDQFAFEVGGEHLVMHKPHTKDLTSSEVVDLRKLLERAGWSPDATSPGTTSPAPAQPTLMVVVDHHEAKIYRVERNSGGTVKWDVKPYDPHHFLHHLTHKDQSREAGQRAPEDPSFYERIGDTLAASGGIVVVGHGTGKSNASRHLIEYLRTHRHETYQRIVREIDADLSAVTPAQLLAMAEQALSNRP
jgi:hypothetical protein